METVIYIELREIPKEKREASDRIQNYIILGGLALFTCPIDL